MQDGKAVGRSRPQQEGHAERPEGTLRGQLQAWPGCLAVRGGAAFQGVCPPPPAPAPHGSATVSAEIAGLTFPGRTLCDSAPRTSWEKQNYRPGEWTGVAEGGARDGQGKRQLRVRTVVREVPRNARATAGTRA